MRSVRRTALDILLKIERQNAFAAPLLADAIPKFESRDRRLLVELVYGVLRWRRSLDAIIEAISRFPLIRMDATILNLLRLGTYQFIFLSRIPAHAIVYSSVEMSKSLRGKKAGGFVNAVLRRISE
ncbi:MAG: 16S rRNA (cytosine(967)-C(5))-methyltransferase RsmB, partial [Deltaproteobacteria bacterium]